MCPECGANPQPISWAGWIFSLGCLGLLVMLAGGFLTCAAGVAGGLAPGEPNSDAWILWIGIGLVVFTLLLGFLTFLRKGNGPKQ